MSFTALPLSSLHPRAPIRLSLSRLLSLLLLALPIACLSQFRGSLAFSPAFALGNRSEVLWGMRRIRMWSDVKTLGEVSEEAVICLQQQQQQQQKQIPRKDPRKVTGPKWLSDLTSLGQSNLLTWWPPLTQLLR
jgi:hypothetical protein